MNHLLYSVEELREIFGGSSLIHRTDACIRTILTDSRKITDASQALYFAIKGRRDGIAYIPEVYRAGGRSFVIADSAYDVSRFPEANFYLVDDTLKALQKLVAHHRSRFQYPVMGITGSNGKTVVKEWLFQLLSPEYRIVRSPKSYNSQIGVPISVWEMNRENTLAIFEAGISKTGEMGNLARIIQPTIGILTNIGEAHQEGFSSREEKITEKLKLFGDVELFIYPTKYLEGYAHPIPGRKQFTWAHSQQADLEIIAEELYDTKFKRLNARFKNQEIQVTIPFTDHASVENGITCWATLLALGYEPQEIEARLKKLLPVNMRLELKNGINNCSIIDDSYSLDLSSLAIALDFLKQQNQHPRRTLILSDIPDLSTDQGMLYTKVASLLENKSVDRLIGVGRQIQKYAGQFPMETLFFETTDELLENIASLKFSNETILLKGARAFEFERISKIIAQKVHETVLEINLSALEHNLNFYKSHLKPGVKLMAMVKAFSYGSGSFEIANLLEFNKVDYLAVAYADEGVSLRKSGCHLPIMVMNPDSGAFDTIIAHHLEPEIYSIRILNEFAEVVKRKNLSNYPVHIKLDTGMHRLGFMEPEVEELLKFLKGHQVLRVQSIFSHLVASEDSHQDEFTQYQLDLFNRLSLQIQESLGYPCLRHMANTSGISRWPQAQFDMVRLGIGLYGIDPVHAQNSALHTVTSLKTSISQIKEIPAGETIGYNRKGTMPQGGKIATVKIGYADGYSRALGNGVGEMLVNGKKVPTIGNICMDMCMLDVTGLDEVAEGDEVIVMNEQIRVEELAHKLHTIPYEILTGISQRVKRVYYYE